MRRPAITSCPCNTVLTQKGSVNNMAAHSSPHAPCHGTRNALRPLSSHSTSCGWIRPITGVSDQQKAFRILAGGIALLICTQRLPRFTRVARCGWVTLFILGSLVRLPIRSTGHAWAARSGEQLMSDSSQCIPRYCTGCQCCLTSWWIPRTLIEFVFPHTLFTMWFTGTSDVARAGDTTSCS